MLPLLPVEAVDGGSGAVPPGVAARGGVREK